MKTSAKTPPAVFWNGRLRVSDELSAMAAGWLDTLCASIPPTAQLTALLLFDHPHAIPLFFAFSTLPPPVVVLPPNPTARRSSPPIDDCFSLPRPAGGKPDRAACLVLVRDLGGASEPSFSFPAA